MAGTLHSGNPNIVEDTYGKQTGPKTPEGKLRVSMNASKNLYYSKDIDTALQELGIKFKKASEALDIKKVFKIWFKSRTGKELSEIERLEELIQILETDTTTRTMRKLEMGLPLNEADIRQIRLLKETLEASHKMKFGEKHLHAHIGYEDIREMMFNEQ